MIKVPHDKPVVVFNCEKQERIGVFNTPTLAARYLYKDAFTQARSRRIAECAQKKVRVCDTIFDFKVTARYANEEDIAILSSRDFVILNGYYTPYQRQMKGFTDTAASLTAGFFERAERRQLESERQKKDKK